MKNIGILRLHGSAISWSLRGCASLDTRMDKFYSAEIDLLLTRVVWGLTSGYTFNQLRESSISCFLAQFLLDDTSILSGNIEKSKKCFVPCMVVWLLWSCLAASLGMSSPVDDILTLLPHMLAVVVAALGSFSGMRL